MSFWADCKFSPKKHKSFLWKRKFFPTWVSLWPYDPKHESDSAFFHSTSWVNGPLNACLWRCWDCCHSGNTSAPRVPNLLLVFVTNTKMLSIIPRRASSEIKRLFSFQFCFLLCIIGRMIFVELCKVLLCLFSGTLCCSYICAYGYLHTVRINADP